REGHPAGALGDADDERHPGEGALHAALEGHHGHADLLLLPQHHVMLEVDPVPLAERDLRHRDDLTLDLAAAAAETDLRHVPEPRRLPPPGVADQVPDV